MQSGCLCCTCSTLPIDLCTASQHLQHVSVTAQGTDLLPAEVCTGLSALAVAAHQFDDRDLKAAAKAYKAHEARTKKQVDMQSGYSCDVSL